MSEIETGDTATGGVAIVGVAGRFPDAAGTSEFWDLLVNGREAVREFSTAEVRAAGIPEDQLQRDDYVRFGTELPDVDQFDAGFFGMTPGEARITDPQHRIFLECAHAALDDAAVLPDGDGQRVGVFASTTISSYLLNNVLRSADFGTAGPLVSFPALIGNDKDFLATRVAYRLNLSGPAMTVQSACSSSLTAIHLACQSLLEQESDVALAGGVSVTVPQTAGYPYLEGGILSRDGHCRPFDADASGTVKGNGCAVVVLKRLSDAVADQDNIYAVIRATAINNDGFGKVGYTAPSAAGQTQVIKEALAFAGIRAADIGYVETHGTGTYLGDPIEIHALTEAYRDDPPTECAIGSLKANIGHLDAAAGVTGVVKAALILKHQVIPPQINFHRPNPELKLDHTPFVVLTEPRLNAGLRAAAVSSFGIGGTNAHCVLVPPPELPAREPEHLIALSAHDDHALRMMAADLLARLAADAAPRVDDLAFTLLAGRPRRQCRLAFPARDLHGVRHGLRAFLDGRPVPTHPFADRWLGAEEEPAVDDFGDFTLARKVSLPPYPLRRDRHWIDPAPGPARSVHHPAPAPADAVPVADIDAEVLAILRRQLNIADLAADDDYFEVGGESLTAVEIVGVFRDRFGVAMSMAEFEESRTAAVMAAGIRRHLRVDPAAAAAPAGVTGSAPPQRVRAVAQVAADRVISRIKAGADDDLFLVHPAGGTTFCYQELVRHSQDAATVYALSFPYHRIDALRTVPDIARHYLGEIREIRPRGPYRLGGYSFGGNVAFEMALQLQEDGETVSDVVMFDALAPAAYAGPELTDAEVFESFPLLLDTALGRAPLPADTPAPTSIDEAMALARQPDWTRYTEEEFRKFLTIWMVNQNALRSHRPTAKLGGDLTVFAAEEDWNAAFVAAVRIAPLPPESWQRHVTGAVTAIRTPGSHYSMLRDTQHIQALAGRFDDWLTARRAREEQ